MRTVTKTLYDNADIRRLNHMTIAECISILESIDGNILPNNYVVLADALDDENHEEYDEDTFKATAYHAAMRKAISALKDKLDSMTVKWNAVTKGKEQ